MITESRVENGFKDYLIFHDKILVVQKQSPYWHCEAVLATVELSSVKGMKRLTVAKSNNGTRQLL